MNPTSATEFRTLSSEETELLLNGLNILAQHRFRWTLNNSGKKDLDIKAMEKLLTERRVFIADAAKAEKLLVRESNA